MAVPLIWGAIAAAGAGYAWLTRNRDVSGDGAAGDEVELLPPDFIGPPTVEQDRLAQWVSAQDGGIRPVVWGSLAAAGVAAVLIGRATKSGRKR